LQHYNELSEGFGKEQPFMMDFVSIKAGGRMKSLCRILLVVGMILAGARGWAADLTFVTEPFPPYSYPVSSSDPTAAGPMAEVVQAVCARIRATCHARVYPWREAYFMVTDGQVDGMFSLMPTEDRKKILYFTDVSVGGAYTFFAEDGDRIHYRKPQDLDGRTIAVYGPSGTSTALENIMNQTTARSVMEVTNDVVLKRIQDKRYGDHPLFLMNRDVAFSMMKQYGIQNMKPVGDLLPVAYAVAFSRKRANSMQVIEFNNAVKALVRDGVIRGILRKYGLTPATP
jgi:polar amino acid transport system substrate-binding protein